MIRDGVDFVPAAGQGATAATTNTGTLTATIPAMTAQVLLVKPGQQITPPPAPMHVRADASWAQIRRQLTYQTQRAASSNGERPAWRRCSQRQAGRGKRLLAASLTW